MENSAYRTTLFPIARAFQVVMRRAEALLQQLYGCGRREMLVLLCVTTNGRSQRDVGMQLGLHPNVVVKILDGMEGAGLLQRTRKREDRRAQVLDVTAKGQALLDRYTKERKQLMHQIFAPLTEQQIEQWRELALLILEEEGVPAGKKAR